MFLLVVRMAPGYIAIFGSMMMIPSSNTGKESGSGETATDNEHTPQYPEALIGDRNEFRPYHKSYFRLQCYYSFCVQPWKNL
jgi:hypothetical protein